MGVHGVEDLIQQSCGSKGYGKYIRNEETSQGMTVEYMERI